MNTMPAAPAVRNLPSRPQHLSLVPFAPSIKPTRAELARARVRQPDVESFFMHVGLAAYCPKRKAHGLTLRGELAFACARVRPDTFLGKQHPTVRTMVTVLTRAGLVIWSADAGWLVTLTAKGAAAAALAQGEVSR